MPSDLGTTYLGVPFRNPFILASAPPTATGGMVRRGFEAGWGGEVVKTLIHEPERNLPNRFAVIRSGGRITGFENLELLSEQSPDQWYQDIAVIKADFPHCPIIGSIMGSADSPDQWLSLARGCQDAGADLLELNFSCPHGYPERGRGAGIGQSPDYAARITGWLANCKDTTIPIIPKLTSAMADIRHIAEELALAGAHGFCAINTIPSFFGFDLHTLRLGVSQQGECVLDGAGPQAQATRFLEDRGADWGARREVIGRAGLAVGEALEALRTAGVMAGPARLVARFDEYTLNLLIDYPGQALHLAAMPAMDAQALLDLDQDEEAFEAAMATLSGALIRHLADRVETQEQLNRGQLRLSFNH